MIDDPNDNDITAIPNSLFGRTYNSAFYSNLIWDVDKTFRIGFEVTYRKTKYKDANQPAQRRIRFPYPVPWTF